MRLLIFIITLTIISCTSNNNKQKELDQKEKELTAKENQLNLRQDSVKKAAEMVSKDQTPVAQPVASQPMTNPSKYTGQWIGQGQDMIEIKYDNGQYFITLDADNSSQPNKTVVKAKEENGRLLVDPGISYGYNGMSTMTPIGNRKLVLKSGRDSYTYERSEN